MPKLPAVLVNPRVAVPTKDVFAALAGQRKDAERTSFGARRSNRARVGR